MINELADLLESYVLAHKLSGLDYSLSKRDFKEDDKVRYGFNVRINGSRCISIVYYANEKVATTAFLQTSGNENMMSSIKEYADKVGVVKHDYFPYTFTFNSYEGFESFFNKYVAGKE
jgi:hypothetical protein